MRSVISSVQQAMPGDQRADTLVVE
jgi:hypothetical protein